MAHFLPSVLANVEGICDEIIAIDSYSTDGTDQLLARHPKVKLYQRPFEFDFGAQKNFAISKATGDWVLIVDSDELLGDRLRSRIQVLIRSRRYTHYKFSRYWLISTDPYRYVHSFQHYPDFQLRLFRNVPFFRYESTKVVHTHFPRQGRGPGKKMRRMHIFHFDFLLKDRVTRENKFRHYSELEPNSTKTSTMYLFEDFDYSVRRVREPLSYTLFASNRVSP
jgi:glycosyltransferase involved in cell wall biosynthesis